MSRYKLTTDDEKQIIEYLLNTIAADFDTLKLSGKVITKIETLMSERYPTVDSLLYSHDFVYSMNDDMQMEIVEIL